MPNQEILNQLALELTKARIRYAEKHKNQAAGTDAYNWVNGFNVALKEIKEENKIIENNEAAIRRSQRDD